MVNIIGFAQRQDLRFEFSFNCLTAEPVFFFVHQAITCQPLFLEKKLREAVGQAEENYGSASQSHVDARLCTALTCCMILSKSS